MCQLRHIPRVVLEPLRGLRPSIEVVALDAHDVTGYADTRAFCLLGKDEDRRNRGQQLGGMRFILHGITSLESEQKCVALHVWLVRAWHCLGSQRWGMHSMPWHLQDDNRCYHPGCRAGCRRIGLLPLVIPTVGHRWPRRSAKSRGR